MTVEFLINSKQNSNWKSKSFQKIEKTQKKSYFYLVTLYLQQSTFFSPFFVQKRKKKDFEEKKVHFFGIIKTQKC